MMRLGSGLSRMPQPFCSEKVMLRYLRTKGMMLSVKAGDVAWMISQPRSTNLCQGNACAAAAISAEVTVAAHEHAASGSTASAHVQKVRTAQVTPNPVV